MGSFWHRWWCIVFGLGVFCWGQQTIQAQETTPALNPNKSLDQFTLDIWNTDNGLPSNIINTMHLDQKGFLWMGSYDGLVRFDGLSFSRFDSQTQPKFKTNSFVAFFEDTLQQTLWMGTEGSGLIAYQSDTFAVFGEQEAFNYRIQAIYPHKGKSLWIGTRGAGVFLFDPEQQPQFRQLPQTQGLTTLPIAQDPRQKHLWIGTTQGILRYDPQTQQLLSKTLPQEKVNVFFTDAQQNFWIGSDRGLLRWQPDTDTFLPIPSFDGETINTLLQDRAGMLWVGTDNFLSRYDTDKQRIEKFSTKEGMPHRIIKEIELDREGSLWVGTYRGGLVRLKEGKFTNFTAKNGLKGTVVDCILPYGADTYLIGIDEGTISAIRGDSVIPTPFALSLPPTRILDMKQAPDGQLWIGTTTNGVLRLNPQTGDRRFFNREQGLSDNIVRKIMIARNGLIWIGTRNGGITRLDPEGKNPKHFNRANGFPSDFIMSIQGQTDGRVIVGTSDAGLLILEDDQIAAHYTTEDGLGSNLVFNTYTDADGIVWITTNAGLSRLTGDTITHYSSRDGLLQDAVFDVLEDDQHNFWLTSSRGVFSIPREDFFRYDRGEIERLPGLMYNRYDGMSNEQCTGAAQSLKAADGRLWFPTLGGVARIDPLNIQRNLLPPPVYITQVRLDGTTLQRSNALLRFPSDAKRFIFDYTALSLVAPEKVRFRYQLEGLDKTWIEAGSERQATYTSLPYGKYRFRVIAQNNDGIWNETGDSISFEIRPYFYQQTGFYVLLVLALILLIVLFFRWRTMRIQRQAQQLEQLVQERTEALQSQTQRLERAYERMQIVSQVGQEIVGAGLDVSSILRALHENVNGIMDVAILAIGLEEKEKQRLQFLSITPDQPDQVLRGYDERSNHRLLSIHCLQSGQSLLINDYESYLKTHNFHTYNKQVNVQSALYVPLRLQEETIGVLTVQSHQTNSYSERQLRTLEALGTYVSVAMDNSKAYQIIKNTNIRITDSLRYALTIQQAILPTEERLSQAFDEYFVLYRPKDIVSGDFYWFSQKNNDRFLAVVDCTGHGVPGAFMSMIGYTLLNEIVNLEGIHDPAQILTRMDEEIRIALRQEEGKNKDTMDVCLCRLTQTEGQNIRLQFAGAKAPLYLVGQAGELEKIKGDRRTVGGGRRNAPKTLFTTHQRHLKAGHALYLSSDGFVDQSTGSGQKIGSPRFAQWIQEQHAQPMAATRVWLESTLDRQQQDDNQRDDITVLGVRC